MKPNVVLTLTSLLCILLLSIHVADDVVHGLDQWGPGSPMFCVVLGILLYGTLMLRDRRAGVIMMLIVGLGALGMPVIHRGAGRIAQTSGGFLFLWTLIALGAIGTLTILLAILGLRKGVA